MFVRGELEQGARAVIVEPPPGSPSLLELEAPCGAAAAAGGRGSRLCPLPSGLCTRTQAILRLKRAIHFRSTPLFFSFCYFRPDWKRLRTDERRFHLRRRLSAPFGIARDGKPRHYKRKSVISFATTAFPVEAVHVRDKSRCQTRATTGTSPNVPMAIKASLL